MSPAPAWPFPRGAALVLLPADPSLVPACWSRLLAGIDPPEAAFGPECRDPRPRAGDTYFLAWHEAGLEQGWACGEDIVGLVYTQAPAPTTRRFGLGLFPAYRGHGFAPGLRDAALALCFREPAVHKAETEIYTSNGASLAAYRRKAPRMRVEGQQRATIQVNGIFYDRLLLGITREEWGQTRTTTGEG